MLAQVRTSGAAVPQTPSGVGFRSRGLAPLRGRSINFSGQDLASLPLAREIDRSILRRMPTLLNNPAHPEAKSATLKIADEYDRLEVRATERMAAEAANKERR
jgi:hypothetical protein